jgi:non-specific serine/threonine protein kinase
LLTQQDSGDVVRFSSLEILRDFARAQLGPDEMAALRERHARFFLRMIECLPPHIARRQKELEAFRAELDNYRTALGWGHEFEPSVALRLAVALWPWWVANGNLVEGREQLQRALDSFEDAPAQLRAGAALGMASLLYYQDFGLAKPWLETALAIYRELDDKRGIAATLCPWSTLMTNLHDPHARDYAQEAWNLAQEIGDENIAAEAAYSLGVFDLGAGDIERSHPELELSIEIFRRNEDLRSLTQSLDLLGIGLWARGKLDEAEPNFDEGFALARRLKWTFMECHNLWGISAVARTKGNIPKALEAARESARIARDANLAWMGPYVIANVAHAEMERGDYARGVTLLGAAQAQHEALGTPLMPVFVPTYERYRARAEEALGDTEFARLWEEGANLGYDEAMELSSS